MIALDVRPRLRNAWLRHDPVRDRWLLLAPERGFVLNATGLAIVRLLDEQLTVGEIAGRVGGDAPPALVREEVCAFLQALWERGVLA
jgi:pyrroloquinoline quinone biosynthesis protein D